MKDENWTERLGAELRALLEDEREAAELVEREYERKLAKRELPWFKEDE